MTVLSHNHPQEIPAVKPEFPGFSFKGFLGHLVLTGFLIYGSLITSQAKAAELEISPYFEVGFGDGGESLGPNVDELSLAANDGIRGAIGIMIYPSGPSGDYRLSAGYGWIDSSDEKEFGPPQCSFAFCGREFDAEVEFESNSFDFMYHHRLGSGQISGGMPGHQWIGIGISYHPDAVYRYNQLGPLGDGKVDFDETVGLQFQYMLSVQNNSVDSFISEFNLGIRYVDIEFSKGDIDVDGNRIEIFISGTI